MKILFALLFSFSAQAVDKGPWPVRIDTSSSNLTSSYTVPQLNQIPNQLQVIDLANGSNGEIEVNCSSYSAAFTPTPGIDSFYVPASTSYHSPFPSPFPLGRFCFLRAVSGTISMGVIDIVGWGY